MTQNRAAALHDTARPWLVDGELHQRWHLLYGEPLDLAHVLGYLGGRITDAKDGGDGHGSSAELDGGATPAEATAMQSKAWTSIYELR